MTEDNAVIKWEDVDPATINPESFRAELRAWQKAKSDRIDEFLRERDKTGVHDRSKQRYALWEPISIEDRDYLINMTSHQVPKLDADGYIELDQAGNAIYTEEEVEADPVDFYPKRRVLSAEDNDKLNEWVEAFEKKTGRLPIGVTTWFGERPTDAQLRQKPLTEEATIVKQLRSLFDTAKKGLDKLDPKTVIASTMDNLKRLQTLDSSFPSPLTKASLHGILGDFVEIAHPTTVASKEMLMYEMLPMIGALMGDAFYAPFGSDKHFSSLFTLAIGRSTDGKGQAMHHCEEAIRLVDQGWTKTSVHSNPASGEGMIRMLAGSTLNMGRKYRVVIANSEMSTTFAAQGRESSTLSGILRKAYDGDRLENFRSDKKKSIAADDYLLGFVGTITPGELQQVMPAMDWVNGAQNRFLWSIAFKDKTLGRSPAQPDFTNWAGRVKALFELNTKEGAKPTAIAYSESGRRVWDDWHASLPEHQDDTLSESQGRVLANCLRVAVLYAQLDERRLDGWQPQIEGQHVEAAIEIVTRSRQSVQWYLAQLNPASKVNHDDIQKIRRAMVEKTKNGAAELTATDVHGLFPRRTAEQREEICIQAGLKLTITKNKKGKSLSVWIN